MSSTRIDVEALEGEHSNEKVMALRSLHQQKVRTLMKTINNQKSEIEKLKRATKEAKMSKKVQSQARKLKEMEVTVDVCKEKMLNKNGGSFESAEQVNDFVLKKTCGAPLRFRPKTREKLQNEIADLEKKIKQLEKKNKRLSDQPTRKVQAESISLTQTPQPKMQQLQGGEDGAGIKALLEQVELLKVAVASRDLNLRSHMDEMERMHADMREMRIFEEKCNRLQRKYNHQKTHLKDLEDELDDITRDKERETHEKETLKAELAMLKNESGGDGEQDNRYLNDLRKLEAQIIALEHECDAKQKRAAEMAQKVHTLKGQLRKAEETGQQGNSSAMQLQGECRSLREQLQHTQRELQEAREQHKRSEIELGKSQHVEEGRADQSGQLQELEEELTKADIEIEQLERENTLLHNEVRSLKEAGQGQATEQDGSEPSRPRPATAGDSERQASLQRIRDLESDLIAEKEANAKLRQTLQGLKSQNEGLLQWKNEEHQRLGDEKQLLQRKLNAANLLRRKK